MTELKSEGSYSDAFGPDDPEFLEALATTVLPGDLPLKPKDENRGQPKHNLSQENAKEGRAPKRRRTRSPTLTDHSEDLLTLTQPADEDSGPQEDAKISPNLPHKPLAPDVFSDDIPAKSPSKKQAFAIHQPDTHQEPLFTTDPVNLADAARVPGYYPFRANVAAERAMESAEFRATSTSAAGATFIDGFYKNSRLHHLSAWKAELKVLVAEAQERAEKEFLLGGQAKEGSSSGPKEGGFMGKVNSDAGVSMRGSVLRSPPKGKAKEHIVDGQIVNTDTVIMHCDFDCFFASVGLVERPHLKNKPVVVCHAQAQGSNSTSEVSSCNYEARKFGIKNGMSLHQAKERCPEVVTIPYEFEKYKQKSLQLYTILMTHSDDLQAVSVDEALIDVTSGVRHMSPSNDPKYDPALEFAEMLRTKVREATGCEVSIGISHNISLARLATKAAKPAGSYHLKLPDLQKYMLNMQLDALHGFGTSLRKKALEKLGVSTLGELCRKPRSVLCDALGKGTGDNLYKIMRGLDDRKLESDKPRKSVSAEINYGIRFEDNEQAQTFMFQLSEEVARRLEQANVRGRHLTLKIMKRDPNAPKEAAKFMGHGICNVYSKQSALPRATRDALLIGQKAWMLLKSFAFDPSELRGIGIQITKLDNEGGKMDKVAHGQSTLAFASTKHQNEIEGDEGGEVKTKEGETPHVVRFETNLPRVEIQPPSQEDETASKEGEASTSISSTFPISSTLPILQVSKGNGNERLDLPSLTQFDDTTLNELPADIRAEIRMEYVRRSASPALSIVSEDGTIMDASAEKRKRRVTSKGTPLSRITQALAPRNAAGHLPGPYGNLFERCKARARGRSESLEVADSGVTDVEEIQASPDKPALRVKVTVDELKKLGIDPYVFAELPAELQMEQLSSVRFSKSFGKK